MTKRAALPTSGPMPAISSPCIRVCVLDQALGLCLGCGRTSDEIAQWSRLEEAARRRIMAGLAARLRRIAGAGGEGTP